MRSRRARIGERMASEKAVTESRFLNQSGDKGQINQNERVNTSQVCKRTFPDALLFDSYPFGLFKTTKVTRWTKVHGSDNSRGSGQMHASGPILTISEVSELLRVHPSTIYKLLQRSQLPGFKIGNSWRVSSEALDSWLAGKTKTRVAVESKQLSGSDALIVAGLAHHARRRLSR